MKRIPSWTNPSFVPVVQVLVWSHSRRASYRRSQEKQLSREAQIQWGKSHFEVEAVPNWPWSCGVDLPVYGSNLPKCRSCGFSVYVYVWYISIWIYMYVPFLLGKLFQHHLSNDVLMMVYSTCFYFGGVWHGRNVRNLLSPGRFPSGSVEKTEHETWNLCFSRPRACYKWRELIFPTTLGN